MSVAASEKRRPDPSGRQDGGLRRAATIALWSAALLGLLVAGTLAAGMMVVATSLDPAELVSGGVEAWTDALEAVAAFAGLCLVAVGGIGFWHTARFKALGVVLTLAEVGAVAWACAFVYREYF